MKRSSLFSVRGYSPSRLYDRLIIGLAKAVSLDDVAQVSAGLIHQALKSVFVAVYIKDIDGHMISSSRGKFAPSVNAVKEVLSGQTIDGERLSVLLGCELALPILAQNKLAGVITIGGVPARRLSTDKLVVSTCAAEVSLAVQRILSIDEVKNFNHKLQREVDRATRELRRQNEQLEHLDKVKDEFVSMASHQLRTPLTSVKGYLSMVLDGDAGEISKEQRQFLGEAYVSSERMVHLIGDFLNVSRLQTGKFMIDARPVNLAHVVAQEVDGMMQIAESHSMKISYRKPSHFPLLMLDEGKLRQVIMNFIDNAIYYSHAGDNIKVEVKIADGEAVFTVSDHGIGVPKDVQKQLFSKFFRAENARSQRPDGTGIGLYLAQKVIDAQGGEMVFSSVEGEGSTFGFRLPVAKLSAAKQSDSLDDQPDHKN